MNSTDTMLLLRERYETVYGIYNHANEDPNRPLASIAMHPGENASEGSALYERIEQYSSHDVGKHFKLSLIEFMDLPTDICVLILELAKKKQDEESKVVNNALNQINSMEKK